VRDTLLEASVPLMLARGIEGTTIDDIVGAAKQSKGTFYRHFEDKTALVKALLQPVEAVLLASFASCEQDLSRAGNDAELLAAYQALSGQLATQLFERAMVAQLYLQECRAPGTGARAPVAALAEHIRRGALALTAAAHQRQLLRDVDPRVSAAAVVGAVERLLHGVLSGEDLGNALRIPDELIRLLLDGLRAPPRPGPETTVSTAAAAAAPAAPSAAGATPASAGRTRRTRG
jgi:AcrR family transcriptional regulator